MKNPLSINFDNLSLGSLFTRHLLWLTVILGAWGCAGPHTPLGAVWSVWPAHPTPENPIQDIGTSGPRIHFTPTRQNLHGPSQITVAIKDPEMDFANYQLSVRYNGFEVSDSFLRRSKLEHKWSERVLVIENPVVRLPASSDHLIEFTYRNQEGQQSYARFEPPRCDAFKPRIVDNTGDFRPSKEILGLISETSLREGISPAFFTGLVAQESRFQPRQVSWAKAVGLTQITSSAEKEIMTGHENWPRYPGIEGMQADEIKILIASGKMNPRNEWRLDPKLSVQGGIEYLRLLTERWSSEANLVKIRSRFQDPRMELTRLVLASYHSGYARVSSALESNGVNWIKAPELREARKYVNRIFSYCNHFGEPEPKGSKAS